MKMSFLEARALLTAAVQEAAQRMESGMVHSMSAGEGRQTEGRRRIISDVSQTDRTPRRRGRRPADADQRRAAVEAALEALESARVPFTMADVAERAGISRATLYRDVGLRALVAGRGDSPAKRPVDARTLVRLTRERDAARAERSEARTALREALREIEALKERVAALVRENEGRRQEQRFHEEVASDTDRIRNDAYAEGFLAGTRAAAQRAGSRHGGSPGLAAAAARLPKPAILSARRTLARALHPDLYAEDPAAAVLATELLKELNELAAR